MTGSNHQLLLLFFILAGHYKLTSGSDWKSKSSENTGKVYHLSDIKVDWETAKTKCSENGWTLAVITDKKENDLVKNLVEDNTWIGLKLVQNAGGLQAGVWSDGSQFNSTTSFSDWAENEPLAIGKCVNLWKKENFTWDNSLCTGNSHFVCEGDFSGAGEAIIDNARRLESNRPNLNELTALLDVFLRFDVKLFKNQSELSRDVLGAFDHFVGNYNVYKDGDVYLNKHNLQININETKSKTEIVLGDDALYSTRSGSLQITLSRNFLDEVHQLNYRQNRVNKTQVASVLYKTTNLFQHDDMIYKKTGVDKNSNITYDGRRLETPLFGESPELRLAPRLLTEVLSAEIRNVTMSNLSSPVNISVKNVDMNIALPKFKNKKSRSVIKCVYWKKNDWSSEGCHLQYDNSQTGCGRESNFTSNSTSFSCYCNHMSHFALILNSSYIYAPKYMDGLSRAGAAIVIVFLLATIITILAFKHMRTDKSRLIILNICINLLAVNVIFVVGIDYTNDCFRCKFTSIALHFFTLAAWGWMFLEATYLFRSLFLSRRFGQIEKQTILIGGVLAYGIPAVIAAMTFVFSPNYLSQKYCWLSADIILYVLVIPIAAVCAINIPVFFFSAYAITCNFKVKIVTEKEVICQSIRRILYMISLLGFPWMFGLLMLLAQGEKVKAVLSILFIIFNTLQGVVIFVLVCVFDETFRNTILQGSQRCCISVVDSVPSLRRHKKVFEVNKPNANEKTSTMTSIDTTVSPKKRRPFRSGWI